MEKYWDGGDGYSSSKSSESVGGTETGLWGVVALEGSGLGGGNGALLLPTAVVAGWMEGRAGSGGEVSACGAWVSAAVEGKGAEASTGSRVGAVLRPIRPGVCTLADCTPMR